MNEAFIDTNVVHLIGKVTIPCVIILTYVCPFATSYWVEVSKDSRHWGLWTVCHTSHNTTNASEVCDYLHVGDSDAYFEAARVLAPAPLLCYAVLLFQLSLMDVKVCKGQLGALVAYAGALLNVAVVVTIGAGYKNDSRWSNDNPTLAWSFWCALPPALTALLDGLAMSYVAHRRRHPFGKRSHRREEEVKTSQPGGSAFTPGGVGNIRGKSEMMNAARRGSAVTPRDVNISGRSVKMNPDHDDASVTPRDVNISGRSEKMILSRGGAVVAPTDGDYFPEKRENSESRPSGVPVTPTDVDNIHGEMEKVNQSRAVSAVAPRDFDRLGMNGKTVRTADVEREKSVEGHDPSSQLQIRGKLQQQRFLRRLHELFRQQELERQADWTRDQHSLPEPC